MLNSIPACYFPLQKIIIDDNQAFLHSLILKMHGKSFSSFSSSTKALNYFLYEYKPSFIKSDMISQNSIMANSSTQHIVNIDVSKLKNLSYNPCYQDISVLVIDHHMPDINGVDFLMKIRHLPIKTLLITGESNYKVAVDAFNGGLVDAYLRKDDSEFLDKIQTIVSNLEWQYFVEMSSFISHIPAYHFLSDKNFIDSFNQFMKDNEVIEFYLIHKEGNFIIKNSQHKKKYLLVRHKNQLKILSNVAKEDGGNSETIEKLNAGKIIPYFGDNEYWQVPAHEWNKFSYQAIQISGESNLFYSVIN